MEFTTKYTLWRGLICFLNPNKCLDFNIMCPDTCLDEEKSEFVLYLDKCSKIVKSWPKWKQETLEYYIKNTGR